jgi:hypothetical protein
MINNEKIRTVYIVISAFLITTFGFQVFSQFPYGFVRDDGYFYSQIAYNLGTKNISSFDGINQTDGYHQLWLYMLAGIAKTISAFNAPKNVYLYCFLFVNILIIFVAAQLLSKNIMITLSFIASMLCCSLLMEGNIWVLLSLVVLIPALRESKTNNFTQLLCCTLIPVVRIDAVIILLCFLLVNIKIDYNKHNQKLIAGLFLGILLHFVSMLVIHHHLVSVSSALKATAERSIINNVNYNLHAGSSQLTFNINPLLLVFLPIAAYAGFLINSCNERNFRLRIGSLWCGSMVFFVTHFLLSSVRPWYFIIPIGMMFLIISQVDLSSKIRTTFRYVASSIVYFTPIFALLGALFLAFKYQEEALYSKKFLEKCREYVPSQKPIFMIDGSGYAGWVCESPIINGDGLVNSHEYASRLVQGTLGDYLFENRIEYILTNTLGEDKDQLANYKIIDRGGLVVRRNDVDLVIRKNSKYPYYFTNYALWKIR